MLPRVGALVEGPAFHPYLSGRANLARLDAADRTADPATAGRRIDAALDRVGLSAAAKKRYRAYSLGMRQRLGIAAALLQPRELLVLDEPTNGLDPQGTREVRTLVQELAADGVTVLISSHLLSEVEQICTHVGVMHVGKLVAQGTLDDLRRSQQPRVAVETDRPGRGRPGADRARSDRRGRSTAGASPPRSATAEPEKVLAALVHAGVPVRQFTVDAAEPRGRVRCADRGGFRCQRLRRSAVQTVPTAGRRPPAVEQPVPALRAGHGVPAPAQPGDPGRAGRDPDRHRDRDQGDRAGRTTAGTARRSCSRSPATGSSSR